MANYKLTYFDIRGRAEPIRLMFAYAGVPYEDNRIKKEDWPALKPKTPQGSLPLLEVDGKVLEQSRTITRYLASELNLYGSSKWERAQVDLILDTMTDFRDPIIKAHFEPDQEKRAALMKQFAEVTVSKYLAILESKLTQNDGGDGFFVGTSLTVADVVVFEELDIRLPELGVSSALKNCPKLDAHRKRISEIPVIAKYLKERPDRPT